MKPVLRRTTTSGRISSKTAENFFAVHEGHGQVEQDQIEVVWTLAEKIETFKTRLSGYDIEASLGKNALGQNESHRLVVDHEDGFASCAGDGGAAFFAFGEKGQVRMEQDPLLGTTCIFDQLRRHFRRAINAGPKHVKILLAILVALPNVLDGGAGPGDDFQQVVQLARGGRCPVAAKGSFGESVSILLTVMGEPDIRDRKAGQVFAVPEVYGGVVVPDNQTRVDQPPFSRS